MCVKNYRSVTLRYAYDMTRPSAVAQRSERDNRSVAATPAPTVLAAEQCCPASSRARTVTA
eukprot:4966422-Pleurochrysis_carterae.AAC.2